MPLPLAVDLPPNGSRTTFVRAHFRSDGLEPVANQESVAQASMAQSTWLIRRAAHQGALAAGEAVCAIRSDLRFRCREIGTRVDVSKGIAFPTVPF